MNQESILEKINELVGKYFEKQKEPFIRGKTTIPIASPPYGFEEVNEAIQSLLSTWVTMGDKVKRFEEEFARYVGVKYAVMVNSGSSANLLALAILSNPTIKSRLNPGDEIITPALTWATTVYPMVYMGLKPVFVDVDMESFNIDANKIEEAITDKTKAIMPVYMLGNPSNALQFENIAQKHNLLLIEDACEAHGAEFDGKKIGSFGDISTFSFFTSHHITTIEGGMLLTNNEEYYELGKALRAFGWIRDLKNKSELIKKYSDIDPRFMFVNLGFNMRPTEIQGSFGIHQIKKLDDFIQLRRDNVKFWQKSLSRFSDYLQFASDPPHGKHVYYGFTILVRDSVPFTSKQLTNYLESKKIETRPVMSGNMVEHPSAKLYDYRISGSLNNSTKVMRDAIFLPNHQDVSREQREFIADCIAEFIDGKKWKN